MTKLSPFSTAIVETYLQSKTGKPQDCEDRIHISEHFIAVIDGATANTNDRWDTQTGGQKSAEIIDATLHHLPHDCTARQAADLMTENIRAFYIEKDILDEVTSHPERRITSSVVVFSLAKEEIWSIGDCQFLLDQTVFSPKKKVDAVTEEARAFFIQSELMTHHMSIETLQERDVGREFIMPLLKRQARFQNNPRAGDLYYAAIDGFAIPADGITVQKIPHTITTVVLASDGYPFLRASLVESEHALADLLQRDPLLFQAYKSTKGLVRGNMSFDDRAYVKVQLCRSRRQ
jgi:glycerophosphoryl diester phosphodiesterase